MSSPEDEKRGRGMMNMLPDPAKEVMTRGRAEKEYVTREEFERFRRGDRILWLILGLGLIIAGWVGMARADTTKMTIDTAYPAVVTVRVPLSRLAQIDSILSHLSFLDGKIVVDCPVAIDVRGKLRCGEYALFVQYLPRMEDSCDGIRSFLVDTTPIVRARGLDSCFSLGYDSTDVFIYKPRWLYRIKHSKDTTFREADELLKGGQ